MATHQYSRMTRKQLLDIYLSNLKKVRKAYADAPKEKGYGKKFFDDYREKFAVAISYYSKKGELVRPSNKRGIAQGRITNLSRRNLLSAIHLQEEFFKNPMSSKSGREKKLAQVRENIEKSRPQAKSTAIERYNLSSEEYDDLLDYITSDEYKNAMNVKLEEVIEELENDVVDGVRDRVYISSDMIIDALKMGYNEKTLTNAIAETTRRCVIEEYLRKTELANEEIERIWWEVLES